MPVFWATLYACMTYYVVNCVSGRSTSAFGSADKEFDRRAGSSRSCCPQSRRCAVWRVSITGFVSRWSPWDGVRQLRTGCRRLAEWKFVVCWLPRLNLPPFHFRIWGERFPTFSEFGGWGLLRGNFPHILRRSENIAAEKSFPFMKNSLSQLFAIFYVFTIELN